MKLSDNEKAALDGQYGEAHHMAMAILCDLGALYGAEEMMPVSQVHIDTTLYMVDAGVEFAQKMAAVGGRVAVATSLNSSAVDLLHPEAQRVPQDLLKSSRKLETAYLKMAAAPTWTCAPYQQGIIPRFGEQIAWGESNAIAFANSIIGARTNRYADLMDICAAIIGKVPKFGLHLTEHRKAQIIINLEGMTTDIFRNEKVFPLLGYVMGGLAADRIPAVTGLPQTVGIDHLKRFSAAAASSGAVGLFHLVGITPEAQDLDMCLQGGRPEEKTDISLEMLRCAEVGLYTLKDTAVDLITLGCPHYSYAEFKSLVRLMNGKKVHSNTVLWVFTSRAVYGWIENSGLLDTLCHAGVSVFTDGCPLQYPKDTWSFTQALSNSVKFVHYCFSQTGLPVALGSTAECIDAAVSGKFSRRKSPWL